MVRDIRKQASDSLAFATVQAAESLSWDAVLLHKVWAGYGTSLQMKSSKATIGTSHLLRAVSAASLCD